MTDSRNSDPVAFLEAVAASARNPSRAVDQRHRTAVAGRPPSGTCVHCGDTFEPMRSDSRYCSNRCRQAAYRARHDSWIPFEKARTA